MNSERERFALPAIGHVSETHSDLATISQQPIEFDFPRRQLPATFHYTGPFFDPTGRTEVPFPWERLAGRPLVYASLGTLQNRLPAVFRAIAEACAGLDVQLVLALGGGLHPDELGELAGDPLVLPYVPQHKILERAALMITHAGMNSALECLLFGVPMVAIPVAHDQPTIAQRIVWTGTGALVELERLTGGTLRNAIKQVITDSRYRQAARRMQQTIRAANGLERAADLVETVMSTGHPVLRITEQLIPSPAVT